MEAAAAAPAAAEAAAHLRAVAPHFEQLRQVIKLAVDVAACILVHRAQGGYMNTLQASAHSTDRYINTLQLHTRQPPGPATQSGGRNASQPPAPEQQLTDGDGRIHALHIGLLHQQLHCLLAQQLHIRFTQRLAALELHRQQQANRAVGGRRVGAGRAGRGQGGMGHRQQI